MRRRTIRGTGTTGRLHGPHFWDALQLYKEPECCRAAAFRLHERRALPPAQTAMRCWDALLCEGPKILFRIALALMKTHEELLLAQDNAGYVLRQMRLAAAATHDRDALMKARLLLCRLSLALPLHWAGLLPPLGGCHRGRTCFVADP